MKFNFSKIKWLFLGLILAACLFCNASVSAQEQGGDAGSGKSLRILYEGTLTDEEGTPVPDGRYNLRFNIWDSPQGGDLVWQEEYVYYEGAVVNKGTLRVVLGRNNPLGLDFSLAPFYLGAEIGRETETGIEWSGPIGPRKEITTLSHLLGERELTEETWAEVENMLRQRTGENGDLIVLMDMGTLGIMDLDQDQALDAQFVDIFVNFIDFLSEKMSQINARLNIVLEKLDNITKVLTDMKGKIDEIHTAIVGSSSISVEQESDSSSDSFSDSDSNSDQESDTDLESESEPGLNPVDMGRAVVQENEDAVKVISSAVQKDSRVFVTFFENPDTSWWVSQKVPGEFFVISLRDPVSRTLEFDYWIVEGEAGSDAETQDTPFFEQAENMGSEGEECETELNEQGVCEPQVEAVPEQDVEEQETDDQESGDGEEGGQGADDEEESLEEPLNETPSTEDATSTEPQII